jgi:hypothetical protein
MIQLRLPLALAVLAASAGLVQAQSKVPLPLELPKPLFVGTPVPINVPNLEKPLGSKRPDLMVPSGTVLLSGEKAVTSSDPFPIIGDLEFITDGEKAGSDGTFVELGPAIQWVQIDLGQSATIHAIALWHFHAQARVYHDVVVQVSDDAEFKSGVTTVFNNDHDNSSELGGGKQQAYIETNEGKLIEVAGVKGRYVRLYSNGNTTDELNHYVEVEVFGIPAK